MDPTFAWRQVLQTPRPVPLAPGRHLLQVLIEPGVGTAPVRGHRPEFALPFLRPGSESAKRRRRRIVGAGHTYQLRARFRRVLKGSNKSDFGHFHREHRGLVV